MYDPLKRTTALQEHAFSGNRRRYYRFRPARWYGGIVTGDVTACNLLCHFCWAGDDIRYHQERVGKLYSPEEAFFKLESIAKKSGYSLMRLSGQEPTIGKEHLLGLLNLLRKTKYKFILETNGILLGAQPDYARDLAEFDNLHVRVSIKGTTESEFSYLTGAEPKFFQLQLASLKNLIDAGVSAHPAVIVSFSTEENIKAFGNRLNNLVPGLTGQIEVEELILYPHVVKRLKKHGLSFEKGHDPDNVPKELV